MPADRVALMSFGEQEVALPAESLLAFLEHDDDPDDDGLLDLAHWLGLAGAERACEVLVRAGAAALRLRVGRVRVEEVAPPVAVPPLLADFCARLGVSALVTRPAGFALLLDPERLARLR
ncbi:MAG: hypothetical protein RLO52_41005 [Sandaracinaceae bacterium]|nr:MAG: hypothetical protein EVA89_16935 [Sandaracinaceae bacterium]